MMTMTATRAPICHISINNLHVEMREPEKDVTSKAPAGSNRVGGMIPRGGWILNCAGENFFWGRTLRMDVRGKMG